MPDEPDKPRDYHRQKSMTLRPKDDEQRERWRARVARLKTTFNKWACELLDKDAMSDGNENENSDQR